MNTYTMNGVKVIRDYNKNTLDWEDAFSNLNDSISNDEIVKMNKGFFVAHNAQRIEKVQPVLSDLNCLAAHIYICINISNDGFGMLVDNDDVWFWQNKGKSHWHFKNNDNYELNEGDLIYVPKGIYHCVLSPEARFGVSMSKE